MRPFNVSEKYCQSLCVFVLVFVKEERERERERERESKALLVKLVRNILRSVW